MSLFWKKNKYYFLISSIIFLFPTKKLANSKTEKSIEIIAQENQSNKNIIHIDGEAEPASIVDIPLPEFDYDFDSFDLGFQPEKELISLLDRPEELTGMQEKELTQEFLIEK